jgi:hypothetical protein
MAARKPRTQSDTYQQKVNQTRQTLDTFNDSSLVGITGLGLKGVQSLKQEIAEIFPASNLPAFLLQGLIQLEDRTLQPDKVEADLTVLFRGSKQIGVYSILAAPALVIHGYQKLLSLAGKDVNAAFPNGLWQYYTEFGLREDAARHCIETNGFAQKAPKASHLDAMTCWAYAAMHTILTYDDLLANQWHEHRLFRSLDDVLHQQARQQQGRRPSARAKAEAYDRAVAERVLSMRQQYLLERLIPDWIRRRPYHLPPKDKTGDYAAYRRACFDAYAEQALRHLPADLREAMEQHHQTHVRESLPAYQRQMTILVTMHPETYQEQRIPLAPHQAHIAILAGSRSYLLGICARNDEGHLLVYPNPTDPTASIPLPLSSDKAGNLFDRYGQPVTIERSGWVRVDGKRLGRLRPPPLEHIKASINAILNHARANPTPDSAPDDPLPVDVLLAESPRSRQDYLRSLLNKANRQALDTLRHASIIINANPHHSAHALGAIRRTQRGCGDHALTLIPTERSMVFDLSHICFDGVWGMELAEIMTGTAAAVAAPVAAIRPAKTRPPDPLELSGNPTFYNNAYEARASGPTEISVETTLVDLRAINRLRGKLSSIELPLTVNDMLILARCMHAITYRPGHAAQLALEQIGTLEGGAAMQESFAAYLEEDRTINPALLIPMDASAIDPSLRIFPATFRNPMLDMPNRLLHCDTLAKQLKRESDPHQQAEFAHERRELYRDLKTFSELLYALRQVTMRGESFSMAAMRLLAHLPKALQNLVDYIPQKIDMLNEIIKGREVFSNVGQVAKTSTITRFFSSRDDGDTKMLIWGIMSDAQGTMHITMRDFRPYVAALVAAGRTDLARTLAQDYLDAYATEANTTIKRIQRILSLKELKET